MNKLTNEEIARVFAMYLNSCKYSPYAESGSFFPITAQQMPMIFSHIEQSHKPVLHLTPLLAITDVDAIKIANISYTEHASKEERLQIGKDYIDYNYLEKGLSNYRAAKLKEFGSKEDIQIFQFLVSCGYAVPLWFGIDHWANNMDAIFLGIAVNKSQKNNSL